MTDPSPNSDSTSSTHSEQDAQETKRIAQIKAQRQAQKEAQRTARNNLGPEKYARLRSEARAPYRGLRKFVYGAIAASGGIGAFVFFTQLIAGRDVGSALPNFAFQMGLVALMVWLFRLEKQN